MDNIQERIKAFSDKLDETIAYQKQLRQNALDREQYIDAGIAQKVKAEVEVLQSLFSILFTEYPEEGDK